MKRPPALRRGLVLGAGGVLGASWAIGALAALEEATGWDPRQAEVLIGTSGGSVLAALLACGVSVTTLLNHEQGAISLDRDGLAVDFDPDATPSRPPLPRLRMGSSHLLWHSALHPRGITPLGLVSSILPEGRGSLANVRTLVEAICEPGQWAPHPSAWIVAMDFGSGRRVAFGRDGAPAAALADAVVASCAIPGWYAPVEINGRRYVDGGTCSPTSLDLLADAGLDEVIVLSPMTSFDYDAPTSRVARLERRFRRIVTRRLVRETARVRQSGTAVAVLSPGAEDLAAIGANLMDPRHRRAVLETSLRTSAEALKRRQPSDAATG